MMGYAWMCFLVVWGVGVFKAFNNQQNDQYFIASISIASLIFVGIEIVKAINRIR